MSSSNETNPIEHLDLRVMVAFAAITAVLVLPAIVNAFTPADKQALSDAAMSLAMSGREALAIVDSRARLTPQVYKAELEDIAAKAADTHSDLEREPIVSGAGSDRGRIADAATEIADAVDGASLAVDDDVARADRRAQILAAVEKLTQAGSRG